MNNKPGARSVNNYEELAPLLEARPMTIAEMDDYFSSKGQHVDRKSMLDFLTNNFLLYEVKRGVYKILTSKDLDDYENKERIRRRIKNGK